MPEAENLCQMYLSSLYLAWLARFDKTWIGELDLGNVVQFDKIWLKLYFILITVLKIFNQLIYITVLYEFYQKLFMNKPQCF